MNACSCIIAMFANMGKQPLKSFKIIVTTQLISKWSVNANPNVHILKPHGDPKEVLCVCQESRESGPKYVQ